MVEIRTIKVQNVMELSELRRDCAVKQKRGQHFILASLFNWVGILALHLSSLNLGAKNLFTFCLSAPLMPIAYGLSRLLKIDFQNKANPLTPLGILFSVNQILYLLIAMWVFDALPEKMLMVYAMIFGAHLMPYSWLYQSRSYMLLSILIPLLALIVGVTQTPPVWAEMMLGLEGVGWLALGCCRVSVSWQSSVSTTLKFRPCALRMP